MIKLMNKQIMSPSWIQAFLKLSKITELRPADKFQLVRLRKNISEISEMVKETGRDLPKDQFADLLEQENEYPFSELKTTTIVGQLSADDLYHLEPLFTKEES